MLPDLISLARRRLEGDLCTAAAPWGQPDASSPCNALPGVGGEGRNPPVSKRSLCNAETQNSSPVWRTARYVSAGGTGIPISASHAAGLYQKSVCEHPEPVQATSSSLHPHCFGVHAAFFFVFLR